MSLLFRDLPEELQGCCAGFLDAPSAGSFGQANKACCRLVERQLAEAKAASPAAHFEEFASSRWCEALFSMHRVPSGPKLIKISDGGRYRCACLDKECRVGQAFSNVKLHLATRQHWAHWRLRAFGDAEPTAAAWLAFKAMVLRV